MSRFGRTNYWDTPAGRAHWERKQRAIATDNERRRINALADALAAPVDDTIVGMTVDLVIVDEVHTMDHDKIKEFDKIKDAQ